MRKLLENEYTQADVEREDEPLALKDPVFRARLEDLQANGFKPKCSKRGNRVMQVKEEDPAGQMDDPIVIRSESPDPVHEPTPPSEPEDFLRTFLTQIKLNDLYNALKKIGVDETALNRMARYDEERLDKFMVKLGRDVPELTQFMCLTLSEEIRRLADTPIAVD
ncbi:hypothetical protein C8R44DRAFT_865268 [Mycena epipterygia]|nr:hypothetical protein C8R44DRAFT_865268 [Mycena epipterygia]